MKIDDRNSVSGISTPGAAGASGVNSGARPSGTGGSSSAGSDTAELSGLTGKIQQADSQAAAGRAAKIDQLRNQVANGTYQVTPAAISQGIVNDALAAGAGGGSSKA